MKKEIKKQWVEDLRSGRYEQGDGHLHNVTLNQWCCLGVLADQAVRAGVAVETTQETLVPNFTVTCYDGQDDFLPRSVMQWSGLKVSDPSVRLTTMQGAPLASLAELNDAGYTFEEIASLIEEQL